MFTRESQRLLDHESTPFLKKTICVQRGFSARPYEYVSVGKHQRSLRARVQREEAGNSPIAVVKNLTAIYAKAAAVKKQPELFKNKCEELYEAVRNIHRRRTVISWTKTAERQKNYHGKVKEYERILRDTLSSISLSISPPDSAS